VLRLKVEVQFESNLLIGMTLLLLTVINFNGDQLRLDHNWNPTPGKNDAGYDDVWYLWAQGSLTLIKVSIDKPCNYSSCIYFRMYCSFIFRFHFSMEFPLHVLVPFSLILTNTYSHFFDTCFHFNTDLLKKRRCHH
jgi:hypothetical protein